MASVYKSYIDEIKSGDYTYPYHVHAIYQIVTNQDLKPSPLPKLEEDNVTTFIGSIGVGRSLGPSSVNSPQVSPNSFSFVAGKENTVKSDNSFVFGEDSVEITVDNSFHIANGDKGQSNYVLSTKTEPNSGFNGLSIFSNSPRAMYSDIMVVGVEALTDGVRFWGVWEFSVSWVEDSGALILEDREQVSKKVPETLRATQVTVDLIDPSVSGNDNIFIRDDRAAGNEVRWAINVQNSENGKIV